MSSYRNRSLSRISTDQSPWFGTLEISGLIAKFNHRRVKVFTWLHLFLSPVSLNIQVSLKHSRTRRCKTQFGTLSLFSVCTQSHAKTKFFCAWPDTTISKIVKMPVSAKILVAFVLIERKSYLSHLVKIFILQYILQKKHMSVLSNIAQP